MATVHAQTTVGLPYPVSVHHEIDPEPSPAFTNPDLILPDEPLYSPHSPSRSLDYGDHSGSRKRHRRDDSSSSAEFGIATAVVVPQRLSVQAAKIITPGNAASYTGYEHGAPLSDIGEEDTSDGGSTTKGNNNSRTPSPDQDGPASEGQPKLRHKKRLSNMSSSSGGSEDGTTWKEFDTSKLMSDRVAADIEHARETADEEEPPSRRNSKELDEELAVLNDRAEKILANARKRLTHMEDNLTKARHSILLSTSRSIPNIFEAANGSSPSLSPSHQPAGSLYRSISQNAHRKSVKGGFPVKASTPSIHARTGSDNVTPSGMKRLSRMPDVRSASATDYTRPRLGVTTPDLVKNAHSPSSSRSWNSPLRNLPEEIDSPSTVQTSPDSTQQTFGTYRGLGIHASGIQGQEDLTQTNPENSSTPTSLDRSNSQASTRSARELTEKMSEMKSRIAELKSKAQADSMKRKSITGSSKSGSQVNDASDKPSGTSQWYSPSQGAAFAAVQRNTNTEKEWRSISQQSHRRKDSLLDEDSQPQAPITPVTVRFLDTGAASLGPSSARTDRNTPSLAKRVGDVTQNNDEELDGDIESMVQASNYEDAEEGLGDRVDDEEIAANEEEQIYLNEVLEESLQEIEPDVPAIPGEYLNDEARREEALSHEDRLDAFDYENMFLHSAMGTYTGNTESDDESDDGSVETSRQTLDTPTHGFGHDSEQDQTEIEDHDDDEVDTDEEMEAVMQSPRIGLSQQAPRNPLAETMGNVSKAHLQPPRKPWMRISRSNSTESTSSTATFATATEGVGTPDEDDHLEILNWGNAPIQQQTSMRVQQQVFPQPPFTRNTPVTNGHRRVVSNTDSSSSSGQPTNDHKHRRTASGSLLNSTLAHSNGASSTNTLERTSSASGQYRIFPSPLPLQQSNSNGRDRSRSIISESSQRTPQASHFPFPLTPPPKSQSQHHRPQPSLTSSPTLPQSEKTSPRSLSSNNLPAEPQRPPVAAPVKANTTILLESLIKLADPHFSLSVDPVTGRVSDFEDLDKELVLGLLRAVGGVCDGILKGQRRNDEEGERLVEDLRERLEMSRDVLIGEWGNDLEEADVDGELDDQPEMLHG